MVLVGTRGECLHLLVLVERRGLKYVALGARDYHADD